MGFRRERTAPKARGGAATVNAESPAGFRRGTSLRQRRIPYFLKRSLSFCPNVCDMVGGFAASSFSLTCLESNSACER
jgi:hypothetical protein